MKILHIEYQTDHLKRGIYTKQTAKKIHVTTIQISQNPFMKFIAACNKIAKNANENRMFILQYHYELAKAADRVQYNFQNQSGLNNSFLH